MNFNFSTVNVRTDVAEYNGMFKLRVSNHLDVVNGLDPDSEYCGSVVVGTTTIQVHRWINAGCQDGGLFRNINSYVFIRVFNNAGTLGAELWYQGWYNNYSNESMYADFSAYRLDNWQTFKLIGLIVDTTITQRYRGGPWIVPSRVSLDPANVEV